MKAYTLKKAAKLLEKLEKLDVGCKIAATKAVAKIGDKYKAKRKSLIFEADDETLKAAGIER